MKFRATIANNQVANLSRWLPKRTRLPLFFFLNRILGRLEGEIALVPVLTESKGVAIDIGASSGYYSFVMSKCFAQVEAFEPLSANTRNLTDYASPKIHVHHEALSDTSGSKNIYLPTIEGVSCYGLASFDEPRNRPYESIQVPVRRLDDFGFRDVSLIKIDVECHEFEVIQGARETIERSRPVLIMEVTSRNKERVGAFFVKLGYETYSLSGDRLEPLPGDLKNATGGVNFVFKPAKRSE